MHNLAIYEGSLSWAWFMLIMGITTGASKIYCNLFPASRIVPRITSTSLVGYLIRINIGILGKIGKNYLELSFDTNSAITAASNLGIRNVKLFPLVSALDSRKIKPQLGLHFRVLVNVRDVNLDRIMNPLRESCKECHFIFPNPNSLYIEKMGFGNVHVSLDNIPKEDYESFIDSFDYMILLYAPTLDSSGKLLDAIVRDIPICIPKQSEEWTAIAAEWGVIHRFDLEDERSLSRIFSHPPFEDKILNRPNPFSPKALVNHLTNVSLETDRPGKIISILVFTMYFTSYPMIQIYNMTSRGVSFGKRQFHKAASTNKKIKNDQN